MTGKVSHTQDPPTPTKINVQVSASDIVFFFLKTCYYRGGQSTFYLYTILPLLSFSPFSFHSSVPLNPTEFLMCKIWNMHYSHVKSFKHLISSSCRFEPQKLTPLLAVYFFLSEFSSLLTDQFYIYLFKISPSYSVLYADYLVRLTLSQVLNSYKY